MRQPEEVYGPANGYHTFIDEIVNGIGARDEDVIDMTNVTEWDDDYQLPWFDAGELYTIARAGANRMRRRTFASVLSWATVVEVPQFHPECMDWTTAYTFNVERERGIPAW